MSTRILLAPLLFTAFAASAQHAGHDMPAPAPSTPAPVADDAPVTDTSHDMSTHDTSMHGQTLPASAATDDRSASHDEHAGHDMSAMDHAGSAVPHDMSMHDAAAPPPQEAASSHAGHDMSTTDHAKPAASAAPHDMSAHDAARSAQDAASPHAGHDMSTMGGHDMHGAATSVSAPPSTPIPVPTEADRAAAFPALAGHPAHDRGRFGFLRIDRLERDDDDGSGWEALGWYGGDIHRAWLRTEGHATDGRVEDASVELLYGRLVAPWWDVVAGGRHDLGEGPSRTWAAVGVQGVAPYKVELRATAYVGDSGRTAARVEAEYDTLLTNRWVLQWRGEVDAYGRDDPARGIGSGLSTLEAGARLRYEITRGFAPYVGVEYERAYGDTATLRREHDGNDDDARIVAGLRLVF